MWCDVEESICQALRGGANALRRVPLQWHDLQVHSQIQNHIARHEEALLPCPGAGPYLHNPKCLSQLNLSIFEVLDEIAYVLSGTNG
jgi:hypothetical protein